MSPLRRMLRFEALENRCLLSAANLIVPSTARLSVGGPTVPVVVTAPAVSMTPIVVTAPAPTTVRTVVTAPPPPVPAPPIVPTSPTANASQIAVTGVTRNETTPLAANGTAFGSVVVFQQDSETFTIVNQGAGPLQLSGTLPVTLGGPQSGNFQVTQQPAATVVAGGSTTFTVAFAPQASGTSSATVTIASNAANAPSFAFAINGTALAVPPVVNAAPAAGLRVKMVLPSYAGTNVYNTLYLPTDWKPGGEYPVIVEFAPNNWAPSNVNGTVDDTELGYYESGGKGYIWATMPCINYTTTPYSNATTWWGDGNYDDPKGVQLTAQYCEQALIQILQNYGGNPAEVFLTGFSRGAIATSYIGLSTPQMADIWAGFIPDSWDDTSTTDLARTDGRPTFLVAGGNGDTGYPASAEADQYLASQGFPTQFNVVPNIGHTDLWIQNGSSVFDQPVQQQLRQWMGQVLQTHPGTYSISGTVTDAQGQPVAGALVQSGATHWVSTDANGNYTLPGLITGARSLSISYGGANFSVNFTLSKSNIQGENFVYSSGAKPTLALHPSQGKLLAAAATVAGGNNSAGVSTGIQETPPYAAATATAAPIVAAAVRVESGASESSLSSQADELPTTTLSSSESLASEPPPDATVQIGLTAAVIPSVRVVDLALAQL